MVVVIIHKGFGGDTLCLSNVDSCISVAMLKGTIEKEWAVVASCQKLVVETQVLQDDQQLISYSPGSTEISVVMLICLDHVCHVMFEVE